MKIDFNSVIRNIAGDPFRDGPSPAPGESDNRPVLTLGKVSVEAVLSVTLDQNNKPEILKGSEKVRRTHLAQKIYDATKNGGVLDLKSEDITLVKNQIDKTQIHPVIVTRAWDILDPQEDE